jgi:hypothetical protein
MEGRQFFYLIVKGTPSQEQHKPIFSCLSKLNWLCLVKVTLRRYFQWSAILPVILTFTFRNLSIPKSQFSKHHGERPSYVTKAIADCRMLELIKFQKLILRRMKNAGESIWLVKAILQIFKPLKMILCFSCDFVPLKFKEKNGQASNLPAQIIWVYY